MIKSRENSRPWQTRERDRKKVECQGFWGFVCVCGQLNGMGFSIVIKILEGLVDVVGSKFDDPKPQGLFSLFMGLRDHMASVGFHGPTNYG